MWTADNRPRYNRDKLRYPSDLTDAEWAHIEPLIPPGKPGVMYILSTGASGARCPRMVPEAPTARGLSELGRVAHDANPSCGSTSSAREKAARDEASPHGDIIDARQSVKSAEKGGPTCASTATASMPA